MARILVAEDDPKQAELRIEREAIELAPFLAQVADAFGRSRTAAPGRRQPRRERRPTHGRRDRVGLAIVRQIAEAYGGVGIESTRDVGTRVRLVLPCEVPAVG